MEKPFQSFFYQLYVNDYYIFQADGEEEETEEGSVIKKGDSEYVVVVSGTKDTGTGNIVWRKVVQNLFIFEIHPCETKGMFVTEFLILGKKFSFNEVIGLENRFPHWKDFKKMRSNTAFHYHFQAKNGNYR